MDNRPIGIFDSGLGGLTVAREIMKTLPNESFVYFGDTARVPYGSRSVSLVINYSRQCIEFLMQQNVKMAVVACGTASATALSDLKERFDLPMTGVIEPGAQGAVGHTKNLRIGIIGTAATIRSGAHRRMVQQLCPDCRVFEQACPLFVPLAEEGWGESEISVLTAKKYLAEMAQAGVDTLVLGCTHYPLLKKSIQAAIGPEVELIDPAVNTAQHVAAMLQSAAMECHPSNAAEYAFFVSDYSQQFREIGSRFLGKPIQSIQKVELVL